MRARITPIREAGSFAILFKGVMINSTTWGRARGLRKMSDPRSRGQGEARQCRKGEVRSGDCCLKG